MIHQMKLKRQPVDLIKSGKKSIELRLYDEKRKQIQIGDLIEFTCLDSAAETLLVRVVALYRFDSFAELYAELPLLKCGYPEESITTASPEDMNAYYSPEEQAKYGVIGIEIEMLEDNLAGSSTKAIQERIYQNKLAKGWNVTSIEKEICLTHGELAEFYEAYRNQLPSAGEELADIAIYLLGIAEILHVDLGEEIARKMIINEADMSRSTESTPECQIDFKRESVWQSLESWLTLSILRMGRRFVCWMKKPYHFSEKKLFLPS